MDCRTRLQGFHFHQKCPHKYATPDKRLSFCLRACTGVCICAVSEEIQPCSLSLDTVQQHPGDYLSSWKVTTSMSLGQSSHKSAEVTHTQMAQTAISDFFFCQFQHIFVLVASNTVPVFSGVTPLVWHWVTAGLTTSVTLEQLHEKTVGGYTY